MDTRPGPGGKRRPADSGVGREALEQAVLPLGAVGHELGHRRHRTLPRVLVDEIRSHPVRREEDDLVGERHLRFASCKRSPVIATAAITASANVNTSARAPTNLPAMFFPSLTSRTRL